MSFAVEVLDPVVVEDTKRQTRLLVDALRVLPHMGLLLHSLKLPKKVNRGILDRMLFSLGLGCCGLLGN